METTNKITSKLTEITCCGKLQKVTKCHCGKKYNEPRWIAEGHSYHCSNCYQWKNCDNCQGKKVSLLDDCSNKECILGKVLVGFKLEVAKILGNE